MTDILFCTTDSKEFTSGDNDLSKQYQSSALLNLRPDVFGLQAWEEYKNTDFSKYRLIWIHLNPRTMEPPWFTFPALLKRKAPNSIMVVEHEYWELFYSQPMPDIVKKYMNKYVDYAVVNTWVARDILEKELSIPVLYKNIGKPRIDSEYWPELLSWGEKHGIFTIRHTSRDSMIRKFEVAKEAGVHIVAVDSEPFTDGHQLQRVADAIGADAECYGRLPWNEFIDKINQCKAIIEMDYVGICRIAYEGAKVHTPTVGVKIVEFRNILYPELGCDTVLEIAKIVRKVCDEEPKAINTYADMILREYWSDEACHQRLMRVFDKIGYRR